MLHRHTLNIDQDLLQRAARLLPGSTTTALVDAGLRALVERSAADRLLMMEGSAPEYQPAPRSILHKHRPEDPG